ncbi:type IX secretion system membrane protein PorP/SprF [Daejeonella sp. H1SJ63]|jgi:type IX secretion system PorP/SprF family membrane protein|uniref:PorP/SprF family type IX secretion system membrane protein n=1 Tax=Daejeonella sp. H1SJ63 TaxID=3034145 RepID=UPI0023EAB3F7|nr:type IX secretion system membrane protein PorP/SprF [Daejeonella sp. H1SJ63]
MRIIDRVVLILIGFFSLNGTVVAQQNAHFSQYMFNSLALNPAYAGSRNVVAATALYRNQWVGVEGAPKTTTFTMDAPLSNDRIGLGFQVGSDKIGITRSANFVLSGAYKIPINDGSLSFGLQGSLNNYHAGFSTVNPDPAGPIPDQAFTADVNKTLYNFGSGIYYSSERFYSGFSVLDFIPNRLNTDSIGVDDITARQRAHAYFATGYVFPVGMDFNLKTSVLLKGVMGAPIQADLNATLWIKEVIAIGAEYRTGADISALMELRLTPQIRIGYAYDKSISSLRNYNSGSHEFMLRYEFSFDRSRTLSPRYF